MQIYNLLARITKNMLRTFLLRGVFFFSLHHCLTEVLMAYTSVVAHKKI